MKTTPEMTTEILLPTREHFKRVKIALESGNTVAIPTETVYGLAGLAFSAQSVAKIFEVKERPHFDPLIVHISQSSAQDLPNSPVIDFSALSIVRREQVLKLAHHFWPGPLTLILPRGAAIPDLVTSGLDTVGVRCPAHPVAQDLLEFLKTPLAAPSANRFGRISPTTAAAVLSELGGRIPFIIDGGACTGGLESTIIMPSQNSDRTWQLLRPGLISPEEIFAQTQIKVQLPVGENPATASPNAPGLLASHYAPTRPLYLLADPIIPTEILPQGDQTVGLLSFSRKKDERFYEQLHKHTSNIKWIILSESEDLVESASRFFSALRELDESCDLIFSTLPVSADHGLGFALTDRLRRAAHR